MNAMPVLLTVLGIGFLIFIHELGHYLAARLAGVRVLVFSLGFGPRLGGFVRNGTDYRLSLIPIGGYVVPHGMDNYDRRWLDPDELHAKGFLARLLFFSGGVIMNLLFALVAFPIVFHNGVEFTAPVVGRVDAGGAAWGAGLRPDDRVLEINGKEVYSFENLRTEVALAGSRPIELLVERGGRTVVLTMTSVYDDQQGLRRIGVRPAVVDEPPPIRVPQGSPAAAAGLRDGDALLALDGAPVAARDAADIEQRLMHGDPTADVALTVRRDGAEQTVRLRPQPLPSGRRIGVSPARRSVLAVRDLAGGARRLGLRTGDEVLTLESEPFFGRDGDFAGIAAGDDRRRVTVNILRGPDRRQAELSAELSAEERRGLADELAMGFDPNTAGNLVYPSDADGPAARAGVRPGDRIVAVGDVAVATWNQLATAVRGAGDGPLPLTVQRGDETAALTLTTLPLLDPGFTLEIPYQRQLYRKEGLWASLNAGLVASLDMVKQLYVTLKEMVTGDVSARNLGGIIQISRVSYAYAEAGITLFLWFLGLLSINLAVVNLLPIPVLDGGHLLFLLVEKIKGSPISARVHSYSLTLGFVFVVALMVFVFYNDILRLL